MTATGSLLHDPGVPRTYRRTEPFALRRLTTAQALLLSFIIEQTHGAGGETTIAKLAEARGSQIGNVRDMVMTLRNRGWVQYRSQGRGLPASVSLTEAGRARLSALKANQAAEVRP